MLNISFQNVSFHYETPFQEVFNSLSLAISDGWKSALIGKNGKGKSTLFKLISGSLQPVSGFVDIPFEVRYFPYSPSEEKKPAISVIKESIAPFALWEERMHSLLEKGDEESLAAYSEYLELYTYYEGFTIDSLIEREASAIGLDNTILNRPFNTLSGGEQTRALILPLFLRKNCFPLLDEPTDHLDLQGRRHLGDYLAGVKRGFIVASHDRSLLDSCTDHVISINNSGINITPGNYSVWKYQSDTEEEFERRQHENLQREIKSLEKAAEQRRKWASRKEKEKNSAHDSGFVSHKAAKMMKRAQSIESRIESRIESKKDLLRNKETVASLRMKQSGKMPEEIISINGLRVDIEGRNIISGLYLKITRGSRTAITGRNGCGKTTLLNVIGGQVPISGGDIYIAKNIKTARAYQMPLWQSGYLKDHLYEAGYDMTNFRFVMSAFSMKGDIFDHPLETFSKGQLRKIDLCRTIACSPQLLIWDEPLNYLDIASREQLEEFLLDQQPTVIFVEHDRFFIEAAATDIVSLG